MKHWHWVIVLLYVLSLMALTVPASILAFHPLAEPFSKSVKDMLLHYLTSWGYWAWLFVMFLSQASLLVVPVRISSKRPVTKRHVFIPVIAAALCMGLLAGGALLAIGETIVEDALNDSIWWMALALLILTWILWASIFRRWAMGLGPRGFIDRQCRVLFKGSILELLVAVPLHIVARCKDYCCAGFATFTGIAFGISVMLLSFGPGVFYLYQDRCKRISKGRDSAKK
ncbi:MAG: hypothetical protein JW800_02875 [Candidatus Omnitrophica bacterium]|nr:hypothetical protein [Candidatus Omnitrophota bacterium]